MTGRSHIPTAKAVPARVLLDGVAEAVPVTPRDGAATGAPASAPAQPGPARPAPARSAPAAAAIRQILLHVAPDHPGHHLAVGVDVAARFDAKLVALYPIRRTLAVRRMLDPGPSAGSVGHDGRRDSVERLRRAADLARATVLRRVLPAGSPLVAAAVEAERAKARAVFDRLSCLAEPARVALEWHAVEGEAGTLLARLGRFHDLIVAPAGDPHAGGTGPDAARRAALRSGRPVLAVPRQWTLPWVGRRVFVLWDGTREAAFAVRAALPFLAAAESVTVLATPDRLPLDVDGLPLFSLDDFLWRHGVMAATSPFDMDGADPARDLLDTAAAGGADLIVCGAFGPWPAQAWPVHAWRLAGFTRALMAQARTPLLLCH